MSWAVPLTVLCCLMAGLTACGRTCTDCIIEPPAAALERGREESLAAPIFQDADWPESKEWWKRFGDPQLDAFVEKTLQKNPTVHIADIKVRIAEGKAEKAGAPLFPQLNYDAASTRHQDSKTSIIPDIQIPGIPTIFPFSYTLTRMTLDFRYEIDWWHKNRNALNAALGEVEAARADAEQARLMLTLSVAEYYFRIQTNYQREVLAKQLVENRIKLRGLAQDRLKKGLDTEIAVRQAEIDVSSAEEFLHGIQQDIIMSQNELRALMSDDFLEEIEVVPLSIGQFGAFPLPRTLEVDLLAHRPDITAQLWRIQKASDETKVAQAEFYPNLDLRGLLGVDTIHIDKLFNPGSQIAAVGPALHLPIFQGGYLRGNLKERQEEYNKAIAEYNQLVLKAVKETIQGMNALRLSTKRLHILHDASEATQNICKLTELRFAKNLNSSIDLLVAQNNMLSMRDREYVLYGYTLLAALSLIKATGGGYEVEYCDCNLGNIR